MFCLEELETATVYSCYVTPKEGEGRMDKTRVVDVEAKHVVFGPFWYQVALLFGWYHVVEEGDAVVRADDPFWGGVVIRAPKDTTVANNIWTVAHRRQGGIDIVDVTMGMKREEFLVVPQRRSFQVDESAVAIRSEIAEFLQEEKKSGLVPNPKTKIVTKGVQEW